MSLHAVFFIVDCLTMFSALLLAGGLLTSQPRSLTARLAALTLLNAAVFIAFQRAIFSGWIPEPYRFDLQGLWLLVPQVMMNTTAGVFMYLCFFLFQEPGTRFPRALTALFILETALEDLVPYLLGITTHPQSVGVTDTDSNLALYLIFETLPALLQSVFVGFALYWTVKDWRADLVEMRRFLRTLVTAVFGFNIVSETLLTRVVIPNDDILMFYVSQGYTVALLALQTAFIVWLWSPVGSMPAALTGEPVVDGLEPTLDLDYAAFTAAMARRVYQEPGLSIASLAAQLSIPEYRLRRLINAKLGYRNFNQMLHAYRVAEAAEALADPRKRHLPILTIALTAGYQSINPFNRAFKESKGVTPSAFRANAQRETHSAEAE
jgi:AraC-like DNA-binding protein